MTHSNVHHRRGPRAGRKQPGLRPRAPRVRGGSPREAAVRVVSRLVARAARLASQASSWANSSVGEKSISLTPGHVFPARALGVGVAAARAVGMTVQ